MLFVDHFIVSKYSRFILRYNSQYSPENIVLFKNVARQSALRWTIIWLMETQSIGKILGSFSSDAMEPYIQHC
jgi:hypothetical protein